MAKVKYVPIAHQSEFHDDDKSKIILLSSGFGGGKTFSLIMKILKLSYMNKDMAGGLLCPSMPEYKKDVLPLMEDILEENRIRYKYNKTDKYFIFPWSKAKLYIFTAEKKIRGTNAAYFGINEVGLVTYERFKEVLGRVRIKDAPCSQIVCSGTPEGIGSWVYEHFIENPRPGTKVIYGDTRNNPHLNEEYIKMLEQNYDQIMIDAYLKGKFVNLNGNSFYYAFDRLKNCDKTITRQNDLPVHIGLDFNVDNHTATLWQRIGASFHCFDEIVLQNSTTEKMAQAFKARNCFPENTFIYPDPAGKARSTTGYPDITILQNLGYYNIKYKSRAPGFRQRQLAVNNLLDKALIKLHPDNCRTLLKDFEAVEQDVKDFSKVKNNAKLTHASDGVDYMLDILAPVSGTKPNYRSEKIR